MSTTVNALRLAEAQAALHQLMTGKQLVSVTDPTGRRLEFSAASSKDLEKYIQTLLAAEAGARRGPFEMEW